MTNNMTDRLVDHYLSRLAEAALALPTDRRTELLAEINEHIAASMSTGTGTDEAAVRTMLDRLGDPADIIEAAMENDPREHPSNPALLQSQRRGIGLEVGAVVMLTVGSLIPLGWVVGVILLWRSGIWRRSEKLLGTLIFPGGPGLALIGGAAVLAALPSPLGIVVLLFVLVAPIIVAFVLLNRARGRTTLVRT